MNNNFAMPVLLLKYFDEFIFLRFREAEVEAIRTGLKNLECGRFLALHGMPGTWECHTLSIQSARLSFQSSELGPPPLTRKGVLLIPPLGPRGKAHSLARVGVGGVGCSDEGTDTVVLYVH